jgi:hypothetical protein
MGSLPARMISLPGVPVKLNLSHLKKAVLYFQTELQLPSLQRLLHFPDP